MDSMVSCIRGRGYASFLVRLFIQRKSMQNRRPPSFLRTKTTMLHQGDWDRHITPPSNISWMCSRTSSTNGGAMCRNCSLKGLVSNNFNNMLCHICAPYLIQALRRRYYGAPSSFARTSGLIPEAIAFNLSSWPSFLINSSSSFCLSSIVNFFGGISVRFQLRQVSSRIRGREQHPGWHLRPPPGLLASQQPNAPVCP